MAVTDQAIERLKAMIGSGQLRPGDRLPKEVDLAAALGLSRSSLREAVRALTLIKVLDVRQGDGTYVSELSADSLVDSLAFILEFHQDSSVLELLEVRRILEPAGAARAALRISPEHLEALEQALERVTIDSPVEQLVEADIAFHRCIAVASGNRMLASLLDGLSGPTQKARIWRAVTQEGALLRTLEEHRNIFEAIRRGDGELARTWSTAHIAGVEEWLRRALAAGWI